MYVYVRVGMDSCVFARHFARIGYTLVCVHNCMQDILF